MALTESEINGLKEIAKTFAEEVLPHARLLDPDEDLDWESFSKGWLTGAAMLWLNCHLTSEVASFVIESLPYFLEEVTKLQAAKKPAVNEPQAVEASTTG